MRVLRSLIALVALAQGMAGAQSPSTQPTSWPSKPVRILVGASPGGGTDIIARMLADKFSTAFGQPFLVENRPGAANTIASDVTAKAPPDGYTLLVGTNTAQAIAPHLMKLGFDPVKDLAPIALIVVVPNVVAVAPTVAATSIKDLVAEIKARPRAVSRAARRASAARSTSHARHSRWRRERGSCTFPTRVRRLRSPTSSAGRSSSTSTRRPPR